MNKIFFLILFGLSAQLQASDYKLATNLVIKGMVPWPIAVLLIDSYIPQGEERREAVASLVRYRSESLVSFLKKYSIDSQPGVSIAVIWPLYVNGEKDLAYRIIENESVDNNLAVCMAFWIPNEFGGEYKLNLIKNDLKFQSIIKRIAINNKLDPMMRINAAIYLVGIGDLKLAKQVAEEIRAKIPEDFNSRVKLELASKHQWPQVFYLKERVDWCLELIAKS